MKNKPIYLDHNASTPLLPEVVQAMLPFLKNHYGNPSSSHPYGQTGKKAIEDARLQLAALLNCVPEEIIFTSGGSESNNMAIKGIADLNGTGHIITSTIEHPAVMEVCRYLEKKGFSVTYLPVDESGMVSADSLRKAIRSDTFLITIMLANNEVGTIQSIREIAQIAHEKKCLIHTDAAQAVGKIHVDVQELGVDLLSVAGHKMNAPKGVGALYIKTGVKISPLIHGAGHEHGLRPGTENVLEIVGLGTAVKIFHQNETKIISELTMYGDQFWNKLKSELPEIQLNGPADHKLPNTVNVYFPGIDANTLLDNLPDIAASAGAACHADSVEPSHVLKAMGFRDERILGSIRFSVGRTTTAEDIDLAVLKIAESYQHLSKNPLTEILLNDYSDIRLTQYTHGLGCACKIRPQNLEKILKKFKALPSEFTQVGFETSDDAAVYRLNDDISIVSTVDFFTPIVDNPFDFGRIAAANSLSDIYAMGAKPLFALNVAAFPEKRLPISVLEQILAGAQEIAREAGIPILGGHTIEDNEPKFGLAVTGIVHPDKIWRNTGAQPGDVLILTKPIGLGILATALKRGLLSDSIKDLIISIMSELNSKSAEIIRRYPVHACTDVTGFGLLGHLWEMLNDGTISATVQYSRVPVIPDTINMIRRDVIPGGTDANLEYLKDKIVWKKSTSRITKIVLSDAQTSGGLLVAIPEPDAEQMVKELQQKGILNATRIGYFEKTEIPKIYVVD
ncbi:selenide, water dikinase SelD [bacterium]|nr:selenide, water dikinase SelD [bacterium]MBU1065165.1 selenide, water dikinase SelD [bacterium]MBU1635865.1 selenide, water dikinase SelD [bacterium]MBU1873486.1 selenide, water dikinase SelD [bacterium]